MVKVEQTSNGVKLTNSKGRIYWLHKSPPHFYYIKKSRGSDIVKTMPDDREFGESDNGFIFIRKK